MKGTDEGKRREGEEARPHRWGFPLVIATSAYLLFAWRSGDLKDSFLGGI